MLKWLASLFLVFTLLAPFPAFSQEAPGLRTLEVDLWPEYDQAAVLVIYRIVLASDVSLPAELSFRVPLESGGPHAVAAKQVDSVLLNLEYQSQMSADWILVNFIATTPEIQLEYYDPRLTRQGTTRSFAYTWPGDYAVEMANLQIQQPFGASNLMVSPGPVQSQLGRDGLLYHYKDIGSLSAGQTFRIGLDYQKPDDTLSVENLSVQPSAPLSSEPSWSQNLVSFLPWSLGLLGMLLIVGGALWYWRSGKQPAASQRRRRSQSVEQSSMETSAEEVYCHQCGKRAAPGDQFCRSCGTRLRIG